MATETLTKDEAELRRQCDLLVSTCAEMAVERGVSIPMLLDRLLTFAAAHAVSIEGTPATARAFRTMAENVERGIFARFDPEPKGRSH